MKFAVNSTVLKDAVAKVAAVIPAKSPIEILEFIKLTESAGTLFIVGTDLEMSVQTEVIIQGENDGTVCVRSSELFNLLKSLPSVEVSVEEMGGKLRFQTPKGKYHIPTMSIDQFPEVSFEPALGEYREVEGNTFKKYLNAVAYAMTPPGNFEPAREGVFVELGKESGFTALEQARLTHEPAPELLSTTGQTAAIILPYKAVDYLIKNLPDDEVEFSFDAAKFVLTTEKFAFNTRLIDAQYPKYQMVIPKESNHNIVVDREALLSAVRRASLFTSKEVSKVALVVSEKCVQVVANSTDRNGVENVECSYGGKGISFAVDVHYLIDALSHFATEEVILELENEKKPLMIFPEKGKGFALIAAMTVD